MFSPPLSQEIGAAMKTAFLSLSLATIMLAGCSLAAFGTGTIARDDFRSGLSQWVVEQAPGGTVTTKDGALVIEDRNGCTVWLNRRLLCPVKISFRAKLIQQGGPCDRVSDLNCFWMATDPKSPEGLLRPGHSRDGRFASYDSLKTYYVGCGGNNNTSTRFRRYSGDGQRPLLPEHDLSASRFLLEGNKDYLIEIFSREKSIEYRRDGVVFFRWEDPAPLQEGWFGFRTVYSHLEIRDFSVLSFK